MGGTARVKKITTYTFQFLKRSISEEEAYEVLWEVVSGKSVIAELNKQSRVRLRHSFVLPRLHHPK